MKKQISDIIKVIPVLIKLIFAYLISIFYKKLNQNIWVLSERIDDARDNAYILFKYIRENHPEINAHYAITKDSADFSKIKKLDNWLQFGSFKHYLFYLSAVVNISSHISAGKPGGTVTSRLENKGVIKTKKVFLQHGIIQTLPDFCLYEKTGVDLFVCGAKPEYKFVSENFGYPPGNVKYLGLCRFDNLHNCIPKSKRQILLMPTWRNWLKNDKTQNFTDSTYYKFYNKLINNEKLHQILQSNNINLIFYPHNDMQEFIGEFKATSNNIIIAEKNKYDVQQLLMDSSLLITDYSSVFFDFAYMKKPILYFQFDKVDFFQKQYREGYFNYENNGFGPVSYDLDTLIRNIEIITLNKFMVEKEYKERIESFFNLYDTKNCERNFMEIRKLLNS